jgi:hypothetical protein
MAVSVLGTSEAIQSNARAKGGGMARDAERPGDFLHPAGADPAD